MFSNIFDKIKRNTTIPTKRKAKINIDRPVKEIKKVVVAFGDQKNSIIILSQSTGTAF